MERGTGDVGGKGEDKAVINELFDFGAKAGCSNATCRATGTDEIRAVDTVFCD